ncbi:MAG: UvrD-helicase domain-containing protein [Deltaproteobacteria bacterium]|nr:UvrD-helicase domain-containing protein [Deltaproteobacteria bacterium]
MTDLNPVKELLRSLNPPQREAVTAQEKAILVFAGAGSGKTRVLTYRIAFLLLSGRVAPEEILAVTFTNKAAGEMKERVCTLMGTQGQRAWVSTFHSACLRILRSHIHHLGLPGDFVIYDETDQQRLMEGLLKSAGVGLHAYPPKTILKEIERAKNRGIGPDEYHPEDFNPYQKKAAEFYPLYQEALRAANALDFGDLLYFAHLLFQRIPQVRDYYQRRFRHILVDEYQDTNYIQHLLIKDLLGPDASLCVVGDDDQSIYRWRGAEPANILSFEQDFPMAKVVKLEQNYRSTQMILQGANAVVCRNRWRQEKRLWTANEPGTPLTLFLAEDEEEEASWVAGRIAAEAKGQYRRCAVFYRINAQSRALEEALMRWGIPYTLVGGVRFYQRKEIKDLLAYLRVMVNPEDVVSLKRILNVPPRGIGPKTLDTLEELGHQKGCSLYQALQEALVREDISPAVRKKAQEVFSLLESLRAQTHSLPLSELASQIIEGTNYMEFLMAQGEEGNTRIENIKEFLGVLKAHKGTGIEGLKEFLDQVALLTDIDEYEDGANRVSLITLHSAKGLEFPVVFIVGLEEGLLPYYLRLGNPEDLEEERRLCYVGMTRAQERLYMSCATRRTLFGGGGRRIPSRFLRDIPQEIICPEGRRTPLLPSSWAWEEGLFSEDTYYEYE